MHLLHTAFNGALARGIGRDLRRKGCSLLGTFKSVSTGGGPYNNLTLLVGNRDNRVVKRRLNVSPRNGDILPKLLFAGSGASGSACGSGGRSGAFSAFARFVFSIGRRFFVSHKIPSLFRRGRGSC